MAAEAAEKSLNSGTSVARLACIAIPELQCLSCFEGVSVIRVGDRYLIFFLFSALAAAQTAEQRTACYLDSVRNQPSLLLAFLHDIPKGGDLHNHLNGTVYAEDLIDFAASDNFCVDRTTSRLIGAPC